MDLLTSVTQLFRRDAAHLEQVVLAPDHISPPAPDTAPLKANAGYFRLWVVEMFLKSDRDWFKTLYPVVQSLTSFHFGTSNMQIAQVAGPGRLQNVDPSHLDRVIQQNLALTPLIPFTGGTVEVEVGLIAMQASDLLQRFLTVMSSFSQLLAVPQLSAALTIANTVSSGVEQLLGVSGNSMVLGYHDTFQGADGSGSAPLAACNIVVLSAPSGTYPPEKLWVKDSHLLYGDSMDSAQPLTGVAYMLLRVETSQHRDDWDSLPNIKEYWDKAIEALGQLDASGNPRVADADIFIRNAVVQALQSPDLTQADQMQSARALRDKYQQYKEAIGAKEIVPVPTLADVAKAARGLSPEPVTLGELFPQ